jgi:hypothetical protein
MSTLYVNSKFVGEMLRELLLAMSGLKYGTLSQDEAIAIYDEWLIRLAEEVGCGIDDNPESVKRGEN